MSTQDWLGLITCLLTFSAVVLLVSYAVYLIVRK